MKRSVLAVLLVLFAVHSAFGGQTSPQKKTSRSSKSNLRAAASAPANPNLPRPSYEAYAVADASDGKVLEGQNLDLRWPQASLTKLMLAAVVVEKIEQGELSLDDRVTVSKKAEGMGGSQVFLKAGEVFSLDELMQAALVESANDAAYAVAEHVAGSSDEFVQLMNRKALSLGMAHTEFYCVHGLPPSRGGGENVTSCSDMILLAREVLQHPQILAWTSIERTTFRNGLLVITNTNKLVGRLPGVDGLKTGYTRKAGFNIVATAKDGERRLIVVVLGSPASRIRDAFASAKLIEHLLAQPVTPVSAGEADGLWLDAPGVEVQPSQQADPSELTATGG
ncbi:MAG: D-alanyl-D-alanine carboxypeptidase family protein [Hyphomicrobiales bacterium]